MTIRLEEESVAVKALQIDEGGNVRRHCEKPTATRQSIKSSMPFVLLIYKEKMECRVELKSSSRNDNGVLPLAFWSDLSYTGNVRIRPDYGDKRCMK